MRLLFFIYNIFFLKLIFKKLVRYFQIPIFEGASLRKKKIILATQMSIEQCGTNCFPISDSPIQITQI